MPEQPNITINNTKGGFRFSYAIIAAVVLLFIYFVTCNPEKSKTRLAIEEVEKLKAQRIEDSIQLKAERDLNEVAVMNATNRKTEAERDADSAWKIVEVTQSKFTGLSKRYAALREGLPDTGLITVDPDYVLTCDTCFDQLDQANREVLFYKSKVNNLGESIVGVLAAKDTAIAIEKRAVEAGKVREKKWEIVYESLWTAYTKSNAPRTQLYPIATAQWTPFNGIGVGAGFLVKLKNEAMMGGTVQTTQSGPVYQLIIGKKISFKRR